MHKSDWQYFHWLIIDRMANSCYERTNFLSNIVLFSPFSYSISQWSIGTPLSIYHALIHKLLQNKIDNKVVVVWRGNSWYERTNFLSNIVLIFTLWMSIMLMNFEYLTWAQLFYNNSHQRHSRGNFFILHTGPFL